jgi:glycosyltransferase involved in cell wall biosynthesis
MKILFSTDGLYRGGKEKQICILAKYFIDNGIKINILTYNKVSSYSFLEEYKIPENIITELSATGFKSGFQAYKDAIKQYSPDIIVNWDIRSGLWGVYLQRKLNIPVVNSSIRIGAHVHFKKYLAEKIIVRFSRYNIANSKAGLKIYGLKENDNNKVIYNAIEVNRKYTDKKETLPLFEEIFNIPIQEHYVVSISIGNLKPIKDHETVIRGLAELNDSNWFHIILGKGPEHEKLNKLIKKLKIETHIKLIGTVNDVEKYLNISDIFIHSSYSEGCSNAILEAMKYQLPIITTKTGGTPEIIFKKATRFFSYKSIKELVNQLKFAHSLIEITKENREDYKNHLLKFDSDKICDQTEKHYKKLILS